MLSCQSVYGAMHWLVCTITSQHDIMYTTSRCKPSYHCATMMPLCNYDATGDQISNRRPHRHRGSTPAATRHPGARAGSHFSGRIPLLRPDPTVRAGSHLPSLSGRSGRTMTPSMTPKSSKRRAESRDGPAPDGPIRGCPGPVPESRLIRAAAGAAAELPNTPALFSIPYPAMPVRPRPPS